MKTDWLKGTLAPQQITATIETREQDPLDMVGDHEQAGWFVARLLLIAARRRWRETPSFIKAVTETEITDAGLQS